MVAALLIRRAQIIASGQPDPYPVSSSDHLHMDFIDADTDKMAILRLVYVLERGTPRRVQGVW